jgi:hypothetical protein
MKQWTIESTFGMSDMAHLSSVSVYYGSLILNAKILKHIVKKNFFSRLNVPWRNVMQSGLDEIPQCPHRISNATARHWST